jgi:hypothetical protein
MAGGVTIEQKNQRDTPALAIGRKFSKFKNEKEKTVQKADVKESLLLDTLRKAWYGFQDYAEQNPVDEWQPEPGRYMLIFGHHSKSHYYNEMIEKYLRGLNLRLSSDDIEQFSLILPEFEKDPQFTNIAGPFLMGLASCTIDRDIRIHLENLDSAVGGVVGVVSKTVTFVGDVFDAGGEMRSGTLVIEGDVESLAHYMHGGKIVAKKGTPDRTGEGMDGGEIEIYGNAGYCVGNMMKGGAIRIFGNAADYLGGETYAALYRPELGKNPWNHTPHPGMEGGIITIEGDAGKMVGNMMRGGEIHLNGNYESIGDVWGGRIFHKGRLIVDK